MKQSLAIIGAGSSGLITLKTALEKLPGWEVVCFEGSDSIRGCWGNLEDDFLSTSTKRLEHGEKVLLFIPESGQFNFVLVSLTAVRA